MTNPIRVLTWPEVKAKGIPYSRMHVDRLEKAGNFPARVQLSAHRVAWLESEIDEWILSRARGPLSGCENAAVARRARRDRDAEATT
jgi:prophage regulatory protein